MSNAAYDFERFGEKTVSHTQKVSQPPELKVVAKRNDAGRQTSFAAYSILTFLTVILVIASVIFNHVKLTELTAKYEKVQNEYQALVEDGNRMRVELEEKVSLRSVEEKAINDLKMAKAEDYQIEYVDLGSESKIVKCIKPNDNLGDKAKTLWLSAMEYIKK